MKATKAEKEALWKEWGYVFTAWIERLGSVPVKLMRSQDEGGGYEKNARHLFLLESGAYAVIVEHGCSCYESREAEISLFPNLKAAIKQFEKPLYEGEQIKWRYHT